MSAPDDRDEKNDNDDKDEKELKEKVLHARISGSLDQELRIKAASLGLSVSNLVRNILLNTFGLVEDVLVDSATVARSARGETPPTPTPPRSTTVARARGQSPPPSGGAAPVLGWQESLLAVNAVCDRCNKILEKGSKAAIAVREVPGARTVLCPKCLKETLRDERHDHE